MIEESAFYHCGHNRLHNAFPNGKMEIFCLVNMTFLTYLTWIVRCESDMIERSGVCYCVVKKLELSSEYLGRYCKQLLNQFFYNFQAIQV